jgi:hypothetical protein
MKPSERNKSDQISESRQKRQRYQPPAIIYEGKITIRAGSPSDPSPGFGDGPLSPFDFPGQ